MKNNVQIFENVEFGEIRTLTLNNEVWFAGKDIAQTLGYERDTKAVVDHVDEEDRKMIDGKTQSYFGIELGQRGGWLINESGLYSLILSSKLPTAKKFKRWVTHDVLPAIRRTGTYSTPAADLKIKRLQIMKQNAKVREAKLWEKLSQEGNDTFKQVCRTYAANTLAGKQILALPEVQERTYTATEIAEILGITPHKLGRLANLHDMKVEKYGKWYHDKARYSSKEVEVFRYYENAIPAFKAILKGGEA